MSDSLPERNGVGAYYADLIAQLDDHGVVSTFLCPGGDLPPGLRFPLPGDSTQQVYLPPVRAFGRAIRAARPDVIVVATPGPYGMLGVRWARKLGIRLIVGFHTDYAGVTDLYRNSILRVLSRSYFRHADRMLFRRADHVLANSAKMVDQARRMGARHVSRIGTLLPKTVLETPVRASSGRFERVLFAGRLAPEKRLETVLEAAEKLPDLGFVIAGDGPLKDLVEGAAARLQNLEYTGWLSRAGLLHQMDQADALVLPSRFESFGNVALEAMGRQRIVAVTRTCGIVNWPALAKRLVVFDLDQPLHEVLSMVRDWSAADRRLWAEGTRLAARDLNRRSLDQWLRILNPGSGQRAEPEDIASTDGVARCNADGKLDGGAHCSDGFEDRPGTGRPDETAPGGR
ncbi:MAG: glycosyltransferase [Xanthomonadaceae bacterium]|nr:glycosyltransferase [Xanthomonadaceae bacterium]